MSRNFQTRDGFTFGETYAGATLCALIYCIVEYPQSMRLKIGCDVVLAGRSLVFAVPRIEPITR